MKLGRSLPTRRRRQIAAALFALMAIVASLIRVSRPDFGLLPMLQPLDVHGTSPNFFIGLSFSLFALLTNDEVDLAYCLKITACGIVGACVYEWVQQWLPARTFDVGDIAATCLGAIGSIVLAIPLLLSAQQAATSPLCGPKTLQNHADSDADAAAEN